MGAHLRPVSSTAPVLPPPPKPTALATQPPRAHEPRFQGTGISIFHHRQPCCGPICPRQTALPAQPALSTSDQKCSHRDRGLPRATSLQPAEAAVLLHTSPANSRAQRPPSSETPLAQHRAAVLLRTALLPGHTAACSAGAAQSPASPQSSEATR